MFLSGSIPAVFVGLLNLFFIVWLQLSIFSDSFVILVR